MMQTEVSVQRPNEATTFPVREHGGANFVSRSMIECQFNDAFRAIPTPMFCQ